MDYDWPAVSRIEIEGSHSKVPSTTLFGSIKAIERAVVNARFAESLFVSPSDPYRLDAWRMDYALVQALWMEIPEHPTVKILWYRIHEEGIRGVANLLATHRPADLNPSADVPWSYHSLSAKWLRELAEVGLGKECSRRARVAFAVAYTERGLIPHYHTAYLLGEGPFDKGILRGVAQQRFPDDQVAQEEWMRVCLDKINSGREE